MPAAQTPLHYWGDYIVPAASYNPRVAERPPRIRRSPHSYAVRDLLNPPGAPTAQDLQVIFNAVPIDFDFRHPTLLIPLSLYTAQAGASQMNPNRPPMDLSASDPRAPSSHDLSWYHTPHMLLNPPPSAVSDPPADNPQITPDTGPAEVGPHDVPPTRPSRAQVTRPTTNNDHDNSRDRLSSALDLRSSQSPSLAPTTYHSQDYMDIDSTSPMERVQFSGGEDEDDVPYSIRRFLFKEG